jgi:hypothetical protein
LSTDIWHVEDRQFLTFGTTSSKFLMPTWTSCLPVDCSTATTTSATTTSATKPSYCCRLTVSRNDAQRLDDIRQARKDIPSLTHRGHAAFRDDVALRYGLERLLEIVGEASSAASEECRGRYPAVPWRDITECESFVRTTTTALIQSRYGQSRLSRSRRS